MKRLSIFIVFLLSMSLLVSAEFSKDNAVTWLKDEVDNQWSSLGNDIEKISFTLLALDLNNEDEVVLDGLSYLQGKEDSGNCYPSGNCNTKDTAMAILALNKLGESTADLIDYLENNLHSTSTGNSNLVIQIITNEEGTCNFGFDEGSSYETTVTSDDSWVYLSDMGVNFDNYVETISVDCDFVSSPRISLIKVDGNNFYILEEKGLTSSTEFVIESGCYSLNENSDSCDVGSTFYASWVLYRLGYDIYTNNYMSDNVGNDELKSAMLSLIDDSELSNLIGMQTASGNIGTVYETSFAIDALKSTSYTDEKDDAISYVEDQQSEDGSIGTLKDTAVALYLIYSSGVSRNDDDDSTGYCGDAEIGPGEECEFDNDCSDGYSCNLQCVCELEGSTGSGESECGNGICENDESTVSCPIDCVDTTDSCGNFICETEKGEDSFVCSEDCYCGDFVCDDSELTNGNCPSDCQGTSSGGTEEPYCGDGFCDFDEDANTCPDDCETGSRTSLWWLWLIIIILIVGGGIFVYLKMKKGNAGKKEETIGPRFFSPKPRTQTISRPQVRRNPRQDRLDKQLDESIKKAKDLLKK